MIKFERHNYESCKGLTIWKSERYHVEIWYCPKNYVIIPHSHPQENIELMYLWGSTEFFRRRQESTESFKPKWYHFGRSFSVNAGDVHWFTVSPFRCLIFVNIAKFLPGFFPKSASIDFLPTT